MARTTPLTDARRGTTRIAAPAAKILPGDARLHHRALVLQNLADQGPLSRADLARLTGLTRVTMSDVVAGLLDDNLLVDLGPRPGTRMGKPATLVGINPSGAYVASLDLSGEHALRGAVVDLAGTIVVEHELELGEDRGEDAVDRTIELARRLLADAPGPVLGLGVGTPGVVDAEGVVRNAPNLRWSRLPLRDRLAEALGVAVHVANDADTAALAEDSVGRSGGAGLILVEIGRGLGAGILLDGHLLRGPLGTAGEIGHVTVDPDGPECSCGRRGCLESFVSVPRLRAELADRTPAEADEVLTAAGRRLGLALAPVVQALGLHDVVLSGPEDLVDGALRESTAATLVAHTRPFGEDEVHLRMSALGHDGVLTGAAALVLDGELGLA